ncbi:hypothetical protein L2E82_12793 [Cichorium intybus]|uniref:Uncharacterized protein n=1 Tax=Cichorium intybus TaxID=13427 RepID=A0ACB9GGV7_CICIN|nr:hypothetical protein L2E82_12793 [Cichorium intybus]
MLRHNDHHHLYEGSEGGSSPRGSISKNGTVNTIESNAAPRSFAKSNENSSEEVERKIPLNYASRYSSRIGGIQKSAYLPFKRHLLNPSLDPSTLNTIKHHPPSLLSLSAINITDQSIRSKQQTICTIKFFDLYHWIDKDFVESDMTMKRMETNESVLLTTRLRDNWIDPHRFFNSSSPSRRRLGVQQRPLPVGLSKCANKSSPVPHRNPPPPPPPTTTTTESPRNEESGRPIGSFWTTQHAKESVVVGELNKVKFDEEPSPNLLEQEMATRTNKWLQAAPPVGVLKQKALQRFLPPALRSISGFETAALKDPCIIAAQEVQKMVNLFDKLDTLLKGPIKAKRLASLTSSLAEVKLNPSYKRATIDNLLEGINKTITIVGKVLYWCVIRTKYALSLLYTGSTKMLRRIPVHQLGKDQWRFFYVLCYFAAPWNTHQV